MERRNREVDDGMLEKVVAINRVSKTVKGGRVMKFSALVVVGDGKGTIGFGMGKAGEVPEAIRKGLEAAKKNMHKIAMKGTTIPHEIVGEFGAGRVLMRRLPKAPALSPAARCVRFWKLPASRTSVPRACAPTTPATWSPPPSTACAAWSALRKWLPSAVRP